MKMFFSCDCPVCTEKRNKQKAKYVIYEDLEFPKEMNEEEYKATIRELRTEIETFKSLTKKLQSELETLTVIREMKEKTILEQDETIKRYVKKLNNINAILHS